MSPSKTSSTSAPSPSPLTPSPPRRLTVHKNRLWRRIPPPSSVPRTRTPPRTGQAVSVAATPSPRAAEAGPVAVTQGASPSATPLLPSLPLEYRIEYRLEALRQRLEQAQVEPSDTGARRSPGTAPAAPRLDAGRGLSEQIGALAARLQMSPDLGFDDHSLVGFRLDDLLAATNAMLGTGPLRGDDGSEPDCNDTPAAVARAAAPPTAVPSGPATDQASRPAIQRRGPRPKAMRTGPAPRPRRLTVLADESTGGDAIRSRPRRRRASESATKRIAALDFRVDESESGELGPIYDCDRTAHSRTSALIAGLPCGERRTDDERDAAPGPSTLKKRGRSSPRDRSRASARGISLGSTSMENLDMRSTVPRRVQPQDVVYLPGPGGLSSWPAVVIEASAGFILCARLPTQENKPSIVTKLDPTSTSWSHTPDGLPIMSRPERKGWEYAMAFAADRRRVGALFDEVLAACGGNVGTPSIDSSPAS